MMLLYLSTCSLCQSSSLLAQQPAPSSGLLSKCSACSLRIMHSAVIMSLKYGFMILALFRLCWQPLPSHLSRCDQMVTD